MTAALEVGRPEAVASRATLVPLAARELRRFVLNPVFLFAVVMTIVGGVVPRGRRGHRDRRSERVPGGLPRRVRHDGRVLADPVDARQRTGRRSDPGHAAGPHRRPLLGRDRAVRLRHPGPARVLADLPARRRGVRAVQPVSADRRPGRADRRPVARRPVARGRAGPLGAVPRRRVRAVPGHLRLGGAGDDPDPFASGLGAYRGGAAVLAVRLLHAPRGNAGVTAWRGSPWFFIGWQLALCAIAVLVALLRGAEGPVRTRIIRTLAIAGAVAVILLVLAATGGFTHTVAT